MTFEVYRRLTLAGRRWSWRLKAKNNRIIAVAGENFHNLSDVLSVVDTLINDLTGAQIKVID